MLIGFFLSLLTQDSCSIERAHTPWWRSLAFISGALLLHLSVGLLYPFPLVLGGFEDALLELCRHVLTSGDDSGLAGTILKQRRAIRWLLRFIGLLLAIEHAVDKARQGGLVLRLLGQFLLFVVIDVARLLT